MGKTLIKRLLAAAYLLCGVTFISIASTASDSLKFHILFHANSAVLNTASFSNEAVLTDFLNEYNNLFNDSEISGIVLSIRGNSSLEGDDSSNELLADKRAQALYDHLINNLDVGNSVVVLLPSKPLLAETEAIFARIPDNLPGINLPEIKRISRTINGQGLRQAFIDLDGGNNGINWNWYADNILMSTRFAEIRLDFTRKTEEQEAVEEIAQVAVAATVLSSEAMFAEPVTAIEKTQPAKNIRDTARCEFRMGTNLLYDAATVANLYFETGFARHLALNISATFSPWDIRTPDIKLRTLVIQPELRWYFSDNFKGHYIGLEGHYGWYNIAVGGKTRYQDRDGNTPLWGAGLSYGYVLQFNRHWGMDFSISAGYANLQYDCFYNIENGAWYNSGTKDWWGPTRVGISIYYQF